MNGYELNEYYGRKKFKELVSNGENKVEFTFDKYNHIDAFITAQTTNYIYGVEIKNRAKKYDGLYDSLIVETIKYDAMTEHQSSNNTKDTNECLMVYFFENICYVLKWTTINTLLDNNIVKLEYKWLPDSTVAYHKMVYKPCYEIPKEYAFKYQLIQDKWKQISRP